MFGVVSLFDNGTKLCDESRRVSVHSSRVYIISLGISVINSFTYDHDYFIGLSFDHCHVMWCDHYQHFCTITYDRGVFKDPYHSTCGVLDFWLPTVWCWIIDEFARFTQKFAYIFHENRQICPLFKIICLKILSFWLTSNAVHTKIGSHFQHKYAPDIWHDIANHYF